MFSELFKLETIQFIFFERFEACKKLNSRFLSLFKFTTKKKNEIHLLRAFTSLQKKN
eukprot:UN24144